MTILVNGKQEQVPDGSSVRALLVKLELGKAPCAVEVNRELVPRSRHESRPLSPGDRVEIVTLVGGG